MVFGEGRRVIWLDKFIGVPGEYLQFKATFNEAAQPMISMPPNNINDSIYFFERNVCPIIFVDNETDALHFIDTNRDKTLIWISSATAGRPIIPTIIQQHPHVKKFYFFCAVIANHVEWTFEHGYENILHFSTHETELLVRLLRDTSDDIITLGKSYLELEQGESARQCFVTSQTLEISANVINSTSAPATTNLNSLTDLIEQAMQMRDDLTQ